MDKMTVKVSVDVVGITMTCVHCGQDIEHGECDEDNLNIITADINEIEGDMNMVIKEEVCPECGCNTFEDIIAFISVNVQ